MTKLLAILIAVFLVSGVAFAADAPSKEDKLKEMQRSYGEVMDHIDLLKNRIRADNYELTKFMDEKASIEKEAAELQKPVPEKK